MSSAKVAASKPCLVNVEKGKRYFWCSCGLSATQPFCDGSHKDTDLTPLVWTADRTGEVLLCACKQTRSQPLCDGSHNSLSDTYAEADTDNRKDALLVDYEDQGEGVMRAQLDNDCYVIRTSAARMQEHDNLKVYPVISSASGAKMLSQYAASLTTGVSPVVHFPGSDAVLFIASGNGRVEIGPNMFDFGEETGICIKKGEGFRIVNDNDEAVIFSITVCPHCESPKFGPDMPEFFDDRFPQRCQAVDADKRESMADRFYQVLVDHETHDTEITQFVGEIPRSRAEHHHHLYEETITILSGAGFMWTDNRKTPVQPGDTIFLPLKEAHSLECTTDGGMRLVGQFYPSMSPAINY